VIPIRFEHILRKNVRNEFVVDTYPCLTWLLGHVPVRMKNVEGVVAARGRQTMVIQNCRKVVSSPAPVIRQSVTHHQKAYTWLSATACDLERSNLDEPT